MTSEQERAASPAPSRVLTVAAVARRLGVAPSTLRTWDRRYGLGPSAHTAGSHRRYSPQDVHRLTVMRGLTLEGVPPAEAALIAISAPVPDAPPPQRDLAPFPFSDPDEVTLGVALDGIEELEADVRVVAGSGPSQQALLAAGDLGRSPAVWVTRRSLPGAPRSVPPGVDGARVDAAGVDAAGVDAGEVDAGEDLSGRLAAMLRADALLGVQALLGPVGPPASRGPAASGGARAGGGRVLPLPAAPPRARGLARAAMALDAGELNRLLRDAISAYGVVGAWESMIVPVLRSLGERWRTTGDGVEVEHLFSEAVLGALRSVTATLYRPRNALPVLLACADGDYHSLPLHVTAAALAEQQVGCRMMGVGMPGAALTAAVRRTGPAVVFLYAHLAVSGPGALADLARQRPSPRVVVGGPGWSGVALPSSVTCVATLPAALAAIDAALI